VLVAIGLIEQGMTPLNAMEFVRKKRRGAFNSKQIAFLDDYKRQRSKKGTLRIFSRFFSSSSRNSGNASPPSAAATPEPAEPATPVAVAPASVTLAQS